MLRISACVAKSCSTADQCCFTGGVALLLFRKQESDDDPGAPAVRCALRTFRPVARPGTHAHDQTTSIVQAVRADILPAYVIAPDN